MTLLAIPNVSEGRDASVIRRLADLVAGSPGAILLDTHTDADHHRTVFTIVAGDADPARDIETGGAPALVDAVVALTAAAQAGIDLRAHDGAHPRVGAVDVAPIVYLDDASRGVAAAAALVLGDRLGSELGLPVLLYGELTEGRRTRADLRRGGPTRLAERIATGELRPDFGPAQLHPTAGAVLVACRPPLIAANFELAAPASVDDARAIASRIREGGPDGLPSVRAIGVQLHNPDRAQVSTNIEDHHAVTVTDVLGAIERHARVRRIEIVGVPPRAALAGLPRGVEVACAGALEDALAAV